MRELRQERAGNRRSPESARWTATAPTGRGPQKSRSALVRGIADTPVIKDKDVFFLRDRDGQLPLKKNHGYGLYSHDRRFLNGYELTMGDAQLSRLAAAAGAGFKAELELTNPDVYLSDGRLMSKEDVAVRWKRLIDWSGLALASPCRPLSVTLRRHVRPLRAPGLSRRPGPPLRLGRRSSRRPPLPYRPHATPVGLSRDGRADTELGP